MTLKSRGTLTIALLSSVNNMANSYLPRFCPYSFETLPIAMYMSAIHENIMKTSGKSHRMPRQCGERDTSRLVHAGLWTPGV